MASHDEQNVKYSAFGAALAAFIGAVRRGKKGQVEVINTSINQTLSRTILTSGTTLLVVAALFLLGGEIIHDFSFALMVGVFVGTYSSIFIASVFLVYWAKRSSTKRA